MHLKKTLLALILCLGLNACSASIPSDKPFIAPDVVAECPELDRLPDQGLTASQVERAWAKDRFDYAKCKSSKNELLNVLRGRGVIDGKG